jgi:hypothetical protein
MEGLRDEHVDGLAVAWKRGDPWAAEALARLGSPRAIQFLAAELERRPRDLQLSSAFRALGAHGVPHLLAFFRCGAKCDPALLLAAGNILGTLGQDAEGAATALMRVAEDKRADASARRGALGAIERIGPVAAGILPRLRSLGERERGLAGAVDLAILAVDVQAATEALLRKLAGPHGFEVYVHLARLGMGARSAAPRIIESLHHKDWEVRLLAARTLAYVRPRSATRPLMQALMSAEDFRLVHVSAEALGYIGDEEALPALKGLSKSHWYPPTRATAAAAVRRIESPAVGGADGPSLEDFRHYVGPFGPALRCPPAQAGPAPDPELRALRYERQLRGVGPGDRVDAPSVSTVLVTPDVGVRVAGGWIAGGSTGGAGEVVFLPSQGRPQTLIEHESIVAIIELDGACFALGGNNVYGYARGVIYRIAQNKQGEWKAVLWRALPGAVEHATVGPDGQLLVDTSGGTVQVYRDGRMEMARCP